MGEENDNGEVQRLLLKEKMRMDEMNAFMSKHKEAFRIAFDYLLACFPPSLDPGFWKDSADKLNNLVTSNPQNPLVPFLTLAVYDYLGKIVKDLKAQD